MDGTAYPIQTPRAMLDSLQRLLQRHQAPLDPESALLADWARLRGDEFKRVRRGPGAVVHSTGSAGAMRIEWGAAQRHYIRGAELRVRVDARLPEALEMLVLSRGLAESLEAQAYQDLTSARQTRADDSTPEESRWLALFERIEVDASEDFKQSFVVASSCVPHARHWAQGELAVRLMRAKARWLAPGAPLVLMTLRGRLYLRTEAGSFDETLLDGVRSLGEAAAVRAQKICTRAGRAASASIAQAGALAVADRHGAGPSPAAVAAALAAAHAADQDVDFSPQRPAMAPASPGALADAIEGLVATDVIETLPALEFEDFHDTDLPQVLPPLGSDIPTDLPL
jgi:hypothetical protein